eukprot:9760849-Lingulodinium_polyedra.AAC.1
MRVAHAHPRVYAMQRNANARAICNAMQCAAMQCNANAKCKMQNAKCKMQCNATWRGVAWRGVAWRGVAWRG